MNGQARTPPAKSSVSSVPATEDVSLAKKLSRQLNWIIVGLLAVILGLTAWVIYTTFIAKPPPPRTQEELNLTMARKAVESTPWSVAAHNELGLSYVDIGAYSHAIKEFKTAIKLDSKATEPRYHLARVYLKQKKTSEAIKELKRTLEIDPNTELAHFELGRIYLKQKKYKKAIGSFGKASEIVPVGGDTHYLLGLAYEKDGQPKNAIREYQEALKFVPNYSPAKKALGRLQNK